MNNSKKVLILGGGGVFGLIPLIFLKSANIENINKKVDFIAGSSIGGILALSFAAGNNPKDVYNLFKDQVDDIFHSTFFEKINPFGAKYSEKYIEKFLKEHFQGKKLGDLSIPVIVPSVSFRYTRPKVYNNFIGSDDLDIPLWEIARATSAAPTYFPPFGKDVLIDGGILENIPIITASTEIKEHLKIGFENLNVFAIGTGNKCVNGKKNISAVKYYTVFNWLSRFLVPYITKSNEIATDLWAKHIGLRNYELFNPLKVDGDLDNYKVVKNGELDTLCLKYMVDFNLKFGEFLNKD